jgi:uncharacterized protein YggE
MSESEVRRSISVQGVGIVRYVPDTASASVGAVVTDVSVKNALQHVDRRMNNVIAVLRDSGIPSEQIQTTDFRVSVDYDYQKPGHPVTGYTVTHIVHFNVKPLSMIGDILVAVIDAGANRVNSLEFTASDPAGAVLRARDQAMDDALARAQQLARHGNLELGHPLRITEGFVDAPEFEHTYRLAESSASSMKIEAGQEQASVNVSVVYEAIAKSA